MEPVVTDRANAAKEAVNALPSIARHSPANAYLKCGVIASALLSTALGVLSAAAWYSGNTALLKILHGALALQPNTAIGFILCGAALFASQRGARRAALLFGAGAGLLGLVTIAEYLAGFDLRINEALMGAAVNRVAADLGRMAPSTALSLLLAGIAFSIASRGEITPTRPMSVGLLGAVMIGIGTIACAGYVTGLSAAYAWDQHNGMALPTAVGFMVVGAGLVALGWCHGSGLPNRSPSWLPLLVGASCLTATLILWQALIASENSKNRQLIRNQEINVHNQIMSSINSIMFELLRSAMRWERFNIESPERIKDEAALLIQWLRGLRAIGWLDENNRMRWIVPNGNYPQLVGADLSSDPQNQAALENVRAEGMALVAARDATPGSDRYFIYTPISDKRQPRGYLIGMFQAQELFDQLIEDEAFIGYSIALYDGDREIYRRIRSDSRYFKRAEESLLSLGGVTWTIRVWPKTTTMAAMESNADLLALLIGMLATALITAFSYLAQTARARARQIQATNEQLEIEIAERQRAEHEVRDSETHYRELFEKAGDSISLISRDGKFIAVNPGFEAMSGFAASEWIGKPFMEMIHKDDLPRVFSYFEKLLGSEAIPNVELRFLTKSGDYRSGEVNASPRQRNGKAIGVMAVVRDVTERKRAQEQIQLQLERISTLREINLAVTSTLDLRSVLNVLVQTIQRLLPYSALLVWIKDRQTGELQRAACWNLDETEWMGRNLAGIPKLVRDAMETGQPVVVDNIQADPRTLDREFYRRNGLIAYLGVPLVAKDEALGVLVFLTRSAHQFDDDEVGFLSSVASQAAVAIHNSQLYEKIQRQARELEEANKLQADFTAMIAHDLRSPLSNIIGIAEMMQQGLFGPASEEQKNWLDRMRNNAKNLVDLVSDFLDISKIESGRIELNRSSTNICELCSAIVANYRPVAASKMIALTYQGDASLPAIEADPRRLDQVMINLIDNAIKFTNEGGKIQVRVVAGLRDEIRLEVQDSGVGIPSSEIGSLFQKYRQADNTRALAHKGTGLGLVICKMIVEAHGGKICVESEEGRGTVVVITLPIETGLKPSAVGETSGVAAEGLRS